MLSKQQLEHRVLSPVITGIAATEALYRALWHTDGWKVERPYHHSWKCIVFKFDYLVVSGEGYLGKGRRSPNESYSSPRIEARCDPSARLGTGLVKAPREEILEALRHSTEQAEWQLGSEPS